MPEGASRPRLPRNPSCSRKLRQSPCAVLSKWSFCLGQRRPTIGGLSRPEGRSRASRASFSGPDTIGHLGDSACTKAFHTLRLPATFNPHRLLSSALCYGDFNCVPSNPSVRDLEK